ncbi:MAG: hypothetical protein M3Y69_06190, partial [Verrucomicrobiota bacterium]|nr:hypothetical protein [Verrucomicrobiota bacterium]
FRLMQTCARIASMLSEIGAVEHEDNVFREAFAFHDRALSLDRTALAKDPHSVLLRRNYAGELVMSAYARVLANEQLPEAEAQSDEGLKIQENLAGADPANAEARQDLAYTYYVNGRIRQLLGDVVQAESNYRQCLAILEPLTAAHPENAETAYDLQRARTGLAELAQAH